VSPKSVEKIVIAKSRFVRIEDFVKALKNLDKAEKELKLQTVTFLFCKEYSLSN
jgi:hypothetical protein